MIVENIGRFFASAKRRSPHPPIRFSNQKNWPNEYFFVHLSSKGVEMRRQQNSYDANGNLTYESTARKKADGHYEPAGMERKLLWDEENRLTALSENGYVSAYVYDADGERTVKMHGGGSASYRNAADSAVTTARPKYTLYASPYFMRDEQGNYLKHIYIGSDRIVSQVVRGSWASDNNPKGGTIANFVGLMTQSKYKAKKDSLQSALNRRYADLQVPFKGVDRDSFIYNSNPAQARATIQQSGTYESQQYFYHKDHLGSSTIITTLDGTITQHVQYIPYGEVFIEQQNDAEWSSPFRFTGKELDEETGLYYFGARYFDPKTVNWYNPDRFSELYPHMNPYSYCGGNPICAIDIHGDTIKWNQNPQAMRLKMQSDLLRKNSTIYNTLYNLVDDLPHNVYVKVDDEDVDMSIREASNGTQTGARGYSQGRQIVFSSSAEVSTLSEEFFHQYQKSFYGLEARSTQELDAEAKILNAIVKIEMNYPEKGITGIRNAIENNAIPITYEGGSWYRTFDMSKKWNMLILHGTSAESMYRLYLREFRSRHKVSGDVYNGAQRMLYPGAYNNIIKRVR